MEESKPGYYAILPANVRYDKRLKPMERLMYAEVTSLLNMNGTCFASNKYFAELYDCTEKAISCYIKHLKELGYIDAEYQKEGTFITKRYLTVNQTAQDKEVSKTVNTTKERIKKTKVKKLPLLEREPENEIEQLEKIYLLNYKNLFDKGKVKTDKPIVNWIASRKLMTKNINEYGFEVIKDAVEKSIDNEFVVEHGYVLTMILSAGCLGNIINGSKKNTKGFKTGSGIDKYEDNGVIF